MIDLDKDFLSSRLSGGSEYKFNYKNPVFIRLGVKQVNWAIINDEKKELWTKTENLEVSKKLKNQF